MAKASKPAKKLALKKASDKAVPAKKAKAKAKQADTSDEKDDSAPSEDQIAQETGANLKPAKRWIEEIAEAKKARKPYWERCDKIIERYVDDDREAKNSDKNKRRYSSLWSVTQTLLPLVYSTPPKPFIGRRFNMDDQTANDASQILQSAITYEVDEESVHDTLEDTSEEFVLTGQGVTWARYSPLFALRESEIKEYLEDDEDEPDDDNVKIGVDADGKFVVRSYPEKVDEAIGYDHLHYRDFLHGFAAKWKHVPWVGRMVPMTRQELIDRFKDKGKLVPLTLQVRDPQKKDASDDEKGMFAKAEIWEIWHKRDRKVYWICPEYAADVLDCVDDPLKLENFFPCARPALGTKKTTSLIPTPDFLLWQDIAMELDDCTNRLHMLQKALRLVGIYSKESGTDLKKIVTQTNDNDMIAIDNWAMFQEKGGLKGVIEWVPLDMVMTVFDKLSGRRQMLVQELYEITGISDIIRGASDPNETAEAQQLKGNYANKRLGNKQDKLARHARESLAIFGEIICGQYSDETLTRIGDCEAWMKSSTTGIFDQGRLAAALKLLRTGMLRRFKIKIDERSLAAQDMQADREDRMTFLQSTAQFLTAAVPLLQAYPDAKGLIMTMLMFGVRAFPLARTTEAEFEAAFKQMMNAQPAPQQKDAPAAPQGKSPAELAVETQKVQTMQQRVQVMDQQRQDRANSDQAQNALRAKEIDLKADIADKDAAIKASKVTGDIAIKADQATITRERMQSDATAERARLSRDMNNDAVNAVQAFSRPPVTADPRAPKQPAAVN